jgi:hypothetical protein
VAEIAWQENWSALMDDFRALNGRALNGQTK